MLKQTGNYFILLIKILTLLSLLTACGSVPSQPEAASNPVPVPAEPTRDPLMPTRAGPTPRPLSGVELSVEQLMLNSHTFWSTLEADGEIHSFSTPSATSPTVREHIQVWVRQPAQFRTLVRPAAGGPVQMTVSDGQSIRYETGELSSLSPGISEPFIPPPGPSDTITPHPLEGSLGSPIAALFFPAGLAQRDGEYKVTSKDTLAGRSAIVVEWSYIPGQLVDRLWVDEQTGVILRKQSFGKQASNTPEMEMIITRIVFDTDIPAETFAIDQPAPGNVPALPGMEEDYPVVTVGKSDLSYINVRKGPGTSHAIVCHLSFGQSAHVTGQSAASDWWQINIDGCTGWVWAELVQFTGDPTTVPVVPFDADMSNRLSK